MTYTSFVLNYLQQQRHGEPIFTEQIASSLAAALHISARKAAAAVSVAIKRLLDGGRVPELRFFQKGIYYRTLQTPFGELGIDREKVIAHKYLLPDRGYETGFVFLNRLGLTTQMSHERQIATNAALGRPRYDRKLDVSVCTPRTTISAENKEHLQFLDALDLLDKAPIDAQEPFALLALHVQRKGLSYAKLLSLADRHYSHKTIICLAHVAGARQEPRCTLQETE